ncbi:hypothetical protein CsSME_00025271 [Camellia sinensis var. sinensis]
MALATCNRKKKAPAVVLPPGGTPTIKTRGTSADTSASPCHVLVFRKYIPTTAP